MASIVTRHASYLAEDAFACDPEIVGAGVAELAAMDPSHRLVVLHAAAASVDARLDAKLDAKLDGAFTSVYVGCMWGGEWSDHLAKNAGVSDAPSAAASRGSGLSFMAGRVAFTLNLRGACAAIDTACSSSIVATHMARESLVSAGGAHDAAVHARVAYRFAPRRRRPSPRSARCRPRGGVRRSTRARTGTDEAKDASRSSSKRSMTGTGTTATFRRGPPRRVPPTPSRSRSRRRRRTRMVDPRRSPRRMARPNRRSCATRSARSRTIVAAIASIRSTRWHIPSANGNAGRAGRIDPIEVAVGRAPGPGLRLAAPKRSGHAEGAAGTQSGDRRRARGSSRASARRFSTS